MAFPPNCSSSLELSISVPGLSSPPLLSPTGGSAMRDLDINHAPSGEEEWMMANMEDEDDNNEAHPRKKLRLTKEQSCLLEESFKQNNTLNPKQKEALALQLKLRPRQVEVWFQNRRARSKLKQTEMECAYLKRWFGSLTEQNRRLQREVEELRALRVGQPTVISPDGCESMLASTLTMCPRCERITTTTPTPTPTTVHDKGPIIDVNNAALSPKVSAPFLQSRHSSAAC